MSLLTEQEQDLISNAIAEAEKLTSGEIRIAVEKNCKGDAFERATAYFAKLGMDKTAHRNGVLIYLAYTDHKFAIIGDKGIHRLVPEDFWETTKTAMQAHFAGGNIANGLIAGIRLAGERLIAHFPYQTGDINELPNDIIFMDESKNMR
jgi:uncharacterized membrane protein